MPKTKELCQGCYDDFYNQNREGGCWMFARATVTKLQRVGTWQPPPYSWHPETRLTCYHAEGYAMLTKDDPRIETCERAAKTKRFLPEELMPTDGRGLTKAEN